MRWKVSQKGGVVIMKRQLRNDSRGWEEIYVNTDKGRRSRYTVNRDTGLDIGRKEKLSERYYRTGRDVGKCNTADEVVKCNSEKSQ